MKTELIPKGTGKGVAVVVDGVEVARIHHTEKGEGRRIWMNAGWVSNGTRVTTYRTLEGAVRAALAIVKKRSGEAHPDV